MRLAVALGVAGGLMAAAVTAQTGAPAKSGILDRAVNLPGIAWNPYGATQSAKQVPAEGVPGDAAVRVTVSRKGANAWDAGAGYPTSKPIAAGDTILVAVYLRVPAAKPGEAVPIPLNATETAPPYAPIAQETVQVGSAWKLYYAAGTASKAFAPGQVQASVQLAGAKQVVELGAAFILDFGKGYDLGKLPKN